jgi:carboxypeptidase PM20D1
MRRAGLQRIGVVFLVALAVPMVLAVICVGRGMSVRSKQIEVAPVPRLQLDEGAISQRLAAAVRFETVSAPTMDAAAITAFNGLHRHLETSFPATHAALRKEILAGHSLLYIWQGTDPSLRPIILIAHQDVVPITPGTDTLWTRPPFSGDVAEGYVWGRGSIDNKAALLGALEAIELLLSQGRAPRRTVILAAQHDEEVRGDGGPAIAAALAQRGVKAEFVLDEGTYITHGAAPGITRPIALVGAAEKGFLHVELTAAGAAGHVATPLRDTAISRLSAAIHNIEQTQSDARLEGSVDLPFDWLAGDMAFGSRLIATNLWLFGPLVKSRMSQGPVTNAFIRSTIAPTVADAGSRFNVLPAEARATIISFVHPGETTHDVLKRMSDAAGPQGVRLRVVEAKEPTPRSSTSTEAFKDVSRAIRQVFPDALVAPSLLIGNVDARHFVELSDNVYRFTPILLDGADRSLIHGINERISITAYGDVVRFYYALIKNAAVAQN